MDRELLQDMVDAVDGSLAAAAETLVSQGAPTLASVREAAAAPSPEEAAVVDYLSTTVLHPIAGPLKLSEEQCARVIDAFKSAGFEPAKCANHSQTSATFNGLL